MRGWFRIIFFLGFGLLVGGQTAVYTLAHFGGGGGPCAVSNQAVTINDIETIIYYPTSNNCLSNLMAPYPTVAFAHGFSLFGLSDGRAANSGNGTHLASNGFVVAIPTLPDEAETRADDLIDVIDYLAVTTAVSNSFLFNKVDTNRLATAGYSLGGTTALMVAARDSRIQSVVALDPVFHTGGPGGGDPIWNPQSEAGNITAPVGILGAPADTCNDQADFEELFPLVGSGHKASYEVVGASHCAFADPGNAFCSFTCGGTNSSAETQLSQKYMTAWFNYYLHFQTSEFPSLFGHSLDADVNNGSIAVQIDTVPKQFSATGTIEAVALSWQDESNPMVAGYELFRRINSGSYPKSPFQQLSNQNMVLDTAVSTDNSYHYELQAIDPAGNIFQRSDEESGTPINAAYRIFLPVIRKD